MFQILEPRSGSVSFVQDQHVAALVGREQELGRLRELWTQVEEGNGQTVTISGEPGIGKSRLLLAFKQAIAIEDLSWSVFHCEPQAKSSDFYPFAERLRREILREPQGGDIELKPHFEAVLGEGAEAEAHIEGLSYLLGLSPLQRERGPGEALSPSQIRRRIFSAILYLLMRNRGGAPAAIIIEDLHWADDSTLELLSLLVSQVPTTKLLLILTYRNEFSPPAQFRAATSQLELRPLSKKDSLHLIEATARKQALPAQVSSQILTKAQGNPLLLEELTKSVEPLTPRESRAVSQERIPVPVGIRDSLMARLDRLGRSKHVAQIASVLGQFFSYELLANVSGLAHEMLWPQVAELVAEGVLLQQGLPPRANLTFKHALIQDLAYETLLVRERQELHRHTASSLATKWHAETDKQPEMLARHFSLGGQPELAVEQWLKAGTLAARRSANREALAHLRSGLKDVAAYPAALSELRLRDELRLRLALPSSLVALSGWSSKELEESYKRAAQLCAELGDEGRYFDILRGLFNVYLLRAEIDRAGETSAQLMELAEERNNDFLIWEARRVRAGLNFYTGRFDESEEDLLAIMRDYDPAKHRGIAFAYGVEPGVMSLCYLGWIKWFTGEHAEAQAKLNEALELSQAVGHPFSLAYAQCFSASYFQCLGNVAFARSHAESAARLAEEHSFPYWRAWAKIVEGWAIASEDDPDQGIAEIKDGLAAYVETASRLIEGYGLALLGEAEAAAGREDEALEAMNKAVASMQETGATFYLPTALASLERIKSGSEETS